MKNKLILFLFTTFLTSCSYTKLPSRFFSKEVCSCLFVEKQSESYCTDYARVSLPIWGHKIDLKNKEVYSQGYFSSAIAKFQNPRLGCQLIQK